MLTEPSRRENSAEHSWHLTVMALTLGEYAPPGTDLARSWRCWRCMISSRSTPATCRPTPRQSEQARQLAAEVAAADRLFALLPPDQAPGLRQLWDEFEERASPEARFARALDRLQPILENVRAGGGTWQERGVTADQVLAMVALIERRLGRAWPLRQEPRRAARSGTASWRQRRAASDREICRAARRRHRLLPERDRHRHVRLQAAVDRGAPASEQRACSARSA